jgi:hypothetical protein
MELNETIFCNTCERRTHHRSIHKYRNNEYKEELKDEFGRVYACPEGHDDWELIECLGCKSVSLELIEYFSEWADDPFSSPTRTTYYPERKLFSRQKPSWFGILTGQLRHEVSNFIIVAYTQIYELVESKKYLAALLTCRALLETIAVENGAENERTFFLKLEVLREKEFITPKQVTFLNESIYDAGSAAMHRGYNPNEKTVGLVLDAIEKLMHTIYIEPHSQLELQKEIPKRVR